MSLRRMFLVPLAGRATHESEVAHWQQVHAQLFRATPGLAGYVQFRGLAEEWDRGRAMLCSETEFADAVTERASFDSEFYRSQVTADEGSFLQRDAAWQARIVDVEDSDRPADRRYAVVRLAGPRPGPEWESRVMSRPTPYGGEAIHLLWTADRAEALDRSAESPHPGFACEPTRIHLATRTPSREPSRTTYRL